MAAMDLFFVRTACIALRSVAVKGGMLGTMYGVLG
jgi:hypothetical protein